MYRDVVKNSKSIYRMAYTLPSLWLAYKLGRLSASVTEAMIDSMGLPGKYFHFRVRNDLELGIITNCCLMKMYLDLRKAGIIDIVGVRYEDLVADPTESIRRILEYCHLPVELTEAGRRGLDVDSQRNCSIAKSIIGGLKEPELTPDAKAITNEHLRNSGLPLIGQECLLEGTITYKRQS
jgi:Sulfotransferase family